MSPHAHLPDPATLPGNGRGNPPLIRESVPGLTGLSIGLVFPLMCLMGWLLYHQLLPIFQRGIPLFQTPVISLPKEVLERLPANLQSRIQILRHQLSLSPDNKALRAELVDSCLSYLQKMRSYYQSGHPHAALEIKFKFDDLMPGTRKLLKVDKDVRILSMKHERIKDDSMSAILVTGKIRVLRPIRGVMLLAETKSKDGERMSSYYVIAGNVLQTIPPLEYYNSSVHAALLDPSPMERRLASGDTLEYMFLIDVLAFSHSFSIQPFLTVR